MRAYLEISLDSEEEKELGMRLGCSEYQNVIWTYMKNYVLATRTGRRHLTV
jgi:hypothetical protein